MRRRRVSRWIFGVALVVATTASSTAGAATATCDGLRSLSLPAATITLTETISGHTFNPPPATGITWRPLTDLPAFCRVTATLRPTTDSEIAIEVWLPATWNGKLQSVGNGAWGGVINYPALGEALSAGYATAGTDTGHSGNSPRFAAGHPEKLADYGYRAVHEMTVAAKAIAAAFYGTGPKLSYWNSCSTGGRQGLMEAQRFPTDYDGIIAGAPVHARTQQLIWHIWIAQAVHKDEASFIPPAKYPVIHQAVLAACDARDGIADGLIENPLACRFDPGVLRCNGADGPSCLTAPQVDAVKKIYMPASNPVTREPIYPGMQPGSELRWESLAGKEPSFEAADFFRSLVFQNDQLDFRTLRFDTAQKLAEAAESGTINALDANLKPFFSRGGKLLLYHGWSDQLVAPLSSVDYYERVLKTVGRGTAANSVRLFMMPGVTHCQGGEGPSAFDKVGTMEQWVEHRQAPDRIVASHSTRGKVDRTRPLCPYPQGAAYKGTGSVDEAASFVCK